MVLFILLKKQLIIGKFMKNITKIMNKMVDMNRYPCYTYFVKKKDRKENKETNHV